MSARPSSRLTGWRRVAVGSQVVALGVLLAGCGDEGNMVDTLSGEASPTAGADNPGGGNGARGADGGDGAGGGRDGGGGDSVDGGDSGGADPVDDKGPSTTSYAVDAPGPFKQTRSADVLLTSTKPLAERTVERIRAVTEVQATVPLSWASASVNGRTLDIAAVNATAFRNFMPVATAQADFVWDRLAGGEVVVDDQIDRKLVDKGDMLRLGSGDRAPSVHVGAYAPLNDQFDETTSFDVLVNNKRGEQLGLPAGNALLLSTGNTTPSFLKKQFDRIIDEDTTLKTLAVEFDFEQTAVLTGGSISGEIGTFSYTDGPDGTVIPEKSWVDGFIRTEEVPILGTVTCNKGMLPQLRGALTEIVQMGLADEINPGEYAGCYYPRYINRSPEYGLSLHSWGIAVDLNVPGNQRGTVGEMDRGVVAIFKSWGFAWGGDWSYTDPMHFEMDRVVR